MVPDPPLQIPACLQQTYVVERGAVLEHEQDVVYKLLGCEVVKRVALVQFLADH